MCRKVEGVPKLKSAVKANRRTLNTDELLSVSFANFPEGVFVSWCRPGVILTLHLVQKSASKVTFTLSPPIYRKPTPPLIP